MSCVAVTFTAPVEVAKTVGAAIPPAVVLLLGGLALGIECTT